MFEAVCEISQMVNDFYLPVRLKSAVISMTLSDNNSVWRMQKRFSGEGSSYFNEWLGIFMCLGLTERHSVGP